MNSSLDGRSLILAWLLAKGYVVVPSAGSRERIQESFDAAQLELSAEEIARTDGLDQNMRLVDGPWCPVSDAALGSATQTPEAFPELTSRGETRR